MKKARKFFTKAIRFRRWTNKSYAVFNSVGKVVSIGVLTISICDKSNAKSHNSSNKINDSSKEKEFYNENEAGLFDIYNLLLLVFLLLLPLFSEIECIKSFINSNVISLSFFIFLISLFSTFHFSFSKDLSKNFTAFYIKDLSLILFILFNINILHQHYE